MKKKILAFILIATFFSSCVTAKKITSDGEYYQLTGYNFSSAKQEEMLDSYVKTSLIPALHQQGVKNVGVFKAIANDTATLKKMYVLMPVQSLNRIAEINQKLSADKSLAYSAYANVAHTATAYDRMEVILLKSFSNHPKLTTPNLKSPKKESVYELRSYESPSEKFFRNKLHMFNEGNEMGIFNRLNFNPVFYGEVIAGSHMPNLMYMTSFENMDDRKAHWKNFGSDGEWKRLSGMPEYKNNVSHIDITFLRPADYSDF